MYQLGKIKNYSQKINENVKFESCFSKQLHDTRIQLEKNPFFLKLKREIIIIIISNKNSKNKTKRKKHENYDENKFLNNI